MRVPSVIVWGCISKMVSAIWWLLMETLTPSDIVISLKKILPPSVEQYNKSHTIIFQHDNAKPYSTKYTMIYFSAEKTYKATKLLTRLKTSGVIRRSSSTKILKKIEAELIRKIVKIWEVFVRFSYKGFTIPCKQDLQQ